MHAGSGVSTDVWTCYAARIMVLSVVPFIIVQLPQVLNTTSISRVTVLISLIVSISLVIAYSIYQVAKAIIMNGRQNLIYQQLNYVFSSTTKLGLQNITFGYSCRYSSRGSKREELNTQSRSS